MRLRHFAFYILFIFLALSLQGNCNSYRCEGIYLTTDIRQENSLNQKKYKRWWDNGEDSIGQFNVPVFAIETFKEHFPFGITDNPYHAIEIQHKNGSYLLINTNKISPNSQIYQLVEQYLFSVLPDVYRNQKNKNGERLIDEVAISVINQTSRKVRDNMTLILSLNNENKIKGGMGYVTTQNSTEKLPLEFELYRFIEKDDLKNVTKEEIEEFLNKSSHRIEGIRTYSSSPTDFKNMSSISSQLLRNEKNNVPSTTMFVTLVSENLTDYYEKVKKFKFIRKLKIIGFSGADNVDILGEIDIDALPD